MVVQHGLQHVHQRVDNDLATIAFELWGGRSKTKQRLCKVGLRLDRNYTHGLRCSTFESWLAAVHGERRLQIQTFCLLQEVRWEQRQTRDRSKVTAAS